MGQKVNPIGLRLGINRLWDSIWYAEGDYPDILLEDLKIRDYIKNKFGKNRDAAIARVTIERFPPDKVIITIYTSRPAIVIGRRGAEIESLKKKIQEIVKGDKKIDIKITPIRRPEVNAQLVAENIARQIERRAPYRRAMKFAIANAMRAGAKGIKVECSGRLGGADMARTEHYIEGRLPLHTLRAKIDYGFAEANTTLGVIGVKVWIYKGDSIDPFEKEEL